jgi:hypothetical protein
MKIECFLHVSGIANNPKQYADSLVLVYLDTCDVSGPYFGESSQYEAFDKAVSTGRPFKFTVWAHKG